MADVQDPVLESLLRMTLREEAASIPFRLRPEDVRPSVARTPGPGWRPIILVAAVALVGLAAGGVMLAGAFRAVPRVEPSAPPAPLTGPLAGLPSFERLLGVTASFDTVIARAEGFAPADSTTVLTADKAMPWVALVFACQGPGLSFGPQPGGPTTVNLPEPQLPQPIDCSGGVLGSPVLWASPDTVHGLMVNAKGGTAWRVIVTGRPVDVPERPASAAAVPGLPTFETLLAARPGLGTEIGRGGGIGDAAGTSFTMSVKPGDRATVVFACDQGPAEFALGTAATVDAGFGIGTVGCDPQGPMFLDLPGPDRGIEYSTFRVRIAPGAAWEALLVQRPVASASPTP